MSSVIQTTGGPLLLPQPEAFEDWRDWARAVNAQLQDMQTNAESSSTVNYYNWTNIPPGSLPAWPEGFAPVWMSQDTAEIFLGNAAYDPPVGGDIVYIDTQAIAAEAIQTGNVAPLAIVSALIGDAAIVNAKIGDLAVNEAKIANLAVTSAKIANLAVGTAHIQDAAVLNAKIGDTIQSAAWDNGTKAGWKIDKTGSIQGRALTIYDNTGTVIFNAGGQMDWGRLLGVSIEATDLVDEIFTAANISTYIEGAAIGTALIADAAIVRALIADAAIGAAQIEDASITNAKIINLVVDKLLSGQLDATIDVATGILKFTVGASALYIGRGFGTSNQFFFWYGPGSVAPADATEALATVFIKITGQAYFFGLSGSSGTGGFRADFVDEGGGSSATVDSGAQVVTGADRTIIVSYDWGGIACRVNPGSVSGSTTATYVLERWNGATWDLLGTDSISGSHSMDGDCLHETMGGSITFVDTSGGVSARYRGRVTARATITYAGSPSDPDDTDTRSQTLGLTILEA